MLITLSQLLLRPWSPFYALEPPPPPFFCSGAFHVPRPQQKEVEENHGYIHTTKETHISLEAGVIVHLLVPEHNCLSLELY